MNCTICGRNLARTITKKLEGHEVTLTLCPDCFARLYPEREQGDFLTSFIGRTAEHGKVCPSCGTTLEDFRYAGVLGCADCYAAFTGELLPTIRFVQGKLRHEGKTPGGDGNDRYDLLAGLLSERRRLEQQLQEAGPDETTRLKEALSRIDGLLYGGEVR